MAHALPLWSAARLRRRPPPPVLALVAVVALLALPVSGAGRTARIRRTWFRAWRCCTAPSGWYGTGGAPVPQGGRGAGPARGRSRRRRAGALSPEAGLTGLGRYLQVFVLVPAAVVLLVRDRGDVRLLAWSMVGLAVWQGTVGVHQYATGTGASYQGEQVRAVGTFGPQDVMGMATVVSLGLVCAVGLALGRTPVRHRLLAAGCALALLLRCPVVQPGGVDRDGGDLRGTAAARGGAAGADGGRGRGGGGRGAGGRLRGGHGDAPGAGRQHHPGRRRARPVGDRPVHHVGGGRRHVARAAADGRRAEGFSRAPRRTRLAGAVLRQRDRRRRRRLPQAAAAVPAQHVPAGPGRAGADRAARARGSWLALLVLGLRRLRAARRSGGRDRTARWSPAGCWCGS